MYSYYLEKGYSIRELASLSFLEKVFLLASMELNVEAQEKAMKEIKTGGYNGV